MTNSQLVCVIIEDINCCCPNGYQLETTLEASCRQIKGEEEAVSKVDIQVRTVFAC